MTFSRQLSVFEITDRCSLYYSNDKIKICNISVDFMLVKLTRRFDFIKKFFIYSVICNIDELLFIVYKISSVVLFFVIFGELRTESFITSHIFISLFFGANVDQVFLVVQIPIKIELIRFFSLIIILLFHENKFVTDFKEKAKLFSAFFAKQCS